MSRNDRITPPGGAHASTPQLSKPDARVRRTRERLGRTLLQLILVKPIGKITVQEILDGTQVGRSTFYLHFRNTNDLLLSQLEMFLETMSTLLSVRQEESRRVVPVTEMFDHIGGQNHIYRALRESNKLADFFDLAGEYFTRGIERRLNEIDCLREFPKTELRTRAIALSGSLLSLLRWWMERGSKASAAELDQLFHRMVWEGFGMRGDLGPRALNGKRPTSATHKL